MKTYGYRQPVCRVGGVHRDDANVFDALVVDEAHRLNEKSGLYAEPGRLTRWSEIIGSAKCAIFFIDEDQRVTWKDIGEKKDIERRAKRAGAKCDAPAGLNRSSGAAGRTGISPGWMTCSGIRETANPSSILRRSSISGCSIRRRNCAR